MTVEVNRTVMMMTVASLVLSAVSTIFGPSHIRDYITVTVTACDFFVRMTGCAVYRSNNTLTFAIVPVKFYSGFVPELPLWQSMKLFCLFWARDTFHVLHPLPTCLVFVARTPASATFYGACSLAATAVIQGKRTRGVARRWTTSRILP
jgi:hypothetical protein